MLVGMLAHQNTRHGHTALLVTGTMYKELSITVQILGKQLVPDITGWLVFF